MLLSESNEHALLKTLAAHYLRHKRLCRVVSTESEMIGSRIDALGIRWNCQDPEKSLCLAIEVKVSRQDFLREFGKRGKFNDGFWTALDDVPDYKYILCPDGLITPDEVPDGWGLLYCPVSRDWDDISSAKRASKRKKPRQHWMLEQTYRAIAESSCWYRLMHSTGEEFNRLHRENRRSGQLVAAVERWAHNKLDVEGLKKAWHDYIYNARPACDDVGRGAELVTQRPCVFIAAD